MIDMTMTMTMTMTTRELPAAPASAPAANEPLFASCMKAMTACTRLAEMGVEVLAVHATHRRPMVLVARQPKHLTGAMLKRTRFEEWHTAIDEEGVFVIWSILRSRAGEEGSWIN